MEPLLFLEAPGHGERHLQELRPERRRRRLLQLVRRGNHGQCPQPSLPQPAEETSCRTRNASTETRTHDWQRIRSTAPVPVVPGLSVTRCNDNEEDRCVLDLRPHLLGVAAQGAQLLLREVPRAASPLGVQEARSFNVGQNTRWHGVGQSSISTLESISRSAPGSIFKSPLARAWYRVCLPVSM